jgi:hypothetical protein
MSVPDPPQIAGVAPSHGSPLGGDRITISGNGLSAVTSVTFGPRPGAALAVASDSALSVVAPPGAGVVDVTASSAAGSTVATGAFAYDSPLALEVVRPDDLLVLGFTFVNATLDPGPPLQVVATGAAPPIVVVHLPPQHIAETAVLAGHPPPAPPGTPAALAGASRLAFMLPTDRMPLPLRLDALLDWRGWMLVSPAVQQAEPGDVETALELPCRLFVAVHGGAQWDHQVAAAVLDGAAELWHRDLLGTPQELVIAWSPDLAGGGEPAAIETQLSAGGRADLVRAGRAQVNRLRLSALGAWSDFEFGRDVETSAPPGGADPGSSLTFWHEVVDQGRDELVKVELTPGTLHPGPFHAVLIEMTERRLVAAADGAPTEALVTTTRLAATTTRVDLGDPAAAGLPNGGRSQPFTELNLRTTRLDGVDLPLPSPKPGGPAIPTVNHRSALFHTVATHSSGQVDLVGPMVFASDGAAAPDVQEVFSGLPPTSVGGAPVTYIRSRVPVVTAIEPGQGGAAGGDAVTITGTGFTAATGVSFGVDVAPAFTVVSDTQIASPARPRRRPAAST